MSFTSAVFLIIFFPVCILFSYLMKKEYRNVFLCVCSMFFYFWCGLKFLILILVSATFAYLFGILLERAKNITYKRIVLTTALLYNIGVLFFYKYLFDLFPDFLSIWASFTHRDAAMIQSPVLPLGISFYTFSILSYILDVYWEKCRAQRNILNVYLYILFFPKVVQGPIMRYSDFEKQLYNGGGGNIEDLNLGFERFIKGMFKKVMIADQLQPLVTYSFNNIRYVGTIPAWIGIFAYLFQLYYDFSGYSDMAIGLGYMVGFKLPENFNHPYMSKSASEFWRRWHSSLGEWFRDYVYMPCFRTIMEIGWIDKIKKKKMLFCDLMALLFTWILTGIWHGSGKKFLVWGLWWFTFIAFERLRDEHRKKVRKAKKLPLKKNTWWQNILDYFVTFIAVLLGQVVFRAESLIDALVYWKRLLVWNTTDGVTFLHQFDNYMVFALTIGLIFCFPIYDVLKEKLFFKNIFTKVVYRVLLLGVAFIAFSYAVSAGYSAFLYEVF